VLEGSIVADVVDLVAELAVESGFSGVIRVDRSGREPWSAGFGLADRRHGIANDIGTQFAIASGVKGFTALVVVSLIEAGALSLSTAARDVLGADLPLISDQVSIEHLLAHRSGIGDYLDEEAATDLTDYVLDVSVVQLDRTAAYLPILAGRPAKFAVGDRFSYCNSGYVVLALIAERVTGQSFQSLVEERVCVPAGMHDTAFLRSDALPGRAAVGYLDASAGSRTNVFHLPVVGSGDGGIYTTLSDMHRFWEALRAGHIVAPRSVQMMWEPRSDVPKEGRRYGLGFWLADTGPAALLEGSDAGVSFRSVFVPDQCTFTVISNISNGAWTVAGELEHLLVTGRSR
jgi:CubicO group peptidase (beta-lactamase class C family)